MGRLQDKVCIITGGAGGQGKVAVDCFAREGAKVVASDVLEKGEQDVAPIAARHPGQVVYVHADVTRRADLEKIVAAALEHFGRIDVLFNNHGAMVGSPFLETSEEEIDTVLNVNIKASFVLSQLVVAQMVKQGEGGSIILNSSIGGVVGFRDMAAYGASKGGVAQLARSMASDLRDHKIRVNAVAPGAIDTPMPHKFFEKVDAETKAAAWKAMAEAHLHGRIGQPEEVVNLVLFLASEEASFMNGAVIPVDGGYSAV